jgi:hypothetical protein
LTSAFEEIVADLNKDHFLQEFAFLRATFRPTAELEVELADSLVLLDDMLIVYQLKSRSLAKHHDPVGESRWFKKKVVYQASKQIRDTLTYLSENPEIQMENFRRHRVTLRAGDVNIVHKVVAFQPHPVLPPENRETKFHRSKTVGVIHIFTDADYRGVVRTLLTPGEISGYLSFRERLIEKWEGAVSQVAETALVGQFLSGDTNSKPSQEYEGYLRRLVQNIDEWDMSGILRSFPDRMVESGGNENDYYQILKELAKLKRDELKQVKIRFVLSLEKSKQNEFTSPYRVAFSRTGCGFIFLPLTRELAVHRRQALWNVIVAHKYEQRLGKCVGVSVLSEGDGWNSCEWIYMQAPWAHEPLIEEFLRHEGNPLREVRVSQSEGYAFDDTAR